MRKRWRLVAEAPTDDDTGFLALLAESWNTTGETFLLRRSAQSAARFHERMLPLRFRVERVNP